MKTAIMREAAFIASTSLKHLPSPANFLIRICMPLNKHSTDQLSPSRNNHHNCMKPGNPINELVIFVISA